MCFRGGLLVGHGWETRVGAPAAFCQTRVEYSFFFWRISILGPVTNLRRAFHPSQVTKGITAWQQREPDVALVQATAIPLQGNERAYRRSTNDDMLFKRHTGDSDGLIVQFKTSCMLSKSTDPSRQLTEWPLSRFDSHPVAVVCGPISLIRTVCKHQ